MPAGRHVYVVGLSGVEQLIPRTSSPLWTFSWGCHGPGAQELAWAIIRDATRDERLADDWFLDLSVEIVSRLPTDGFTLTAGEVVKWLDTSMV